MTMLIDQINLNQLRVFESVCRLKSMTLAAKELHLTQSGVSQHIKSLEEILELKLFDRVRQKLVPTPAAKDLYKHTSKGFEEIEGILAKLKNVDQVLQGMVSIGMPIEFGNNIVIPLLTEFQKKNPKVHFRVRQGFPFEMNQLLLTGELDFAFVDSFSMDKAIATEPVYNELLELCAPSEMEEKAKSAKDKNLFEGMSYVDYQEDQSVLRLWMAHHLGWKNPELDVRFYVQDAQAISKLILQGVGAGVLPGHLVQRLMDRGDSVHIVKGSGRPLINVISVAHLKDRSLAPAARSSLEYLRKNIKQN